MNKQIILNALRWQLAILEDDLLYDKAEAAFLWDQCDKSRPNETAVSYTFYKQYKNRIRENQRKLKAIRETIRQVKKIK
jgi:hypothetical protein